jgi:hypothetical protein
MSLKTKIGWSLMLDEHETATASPRTGCMRKPKSKANSYHIAHCKKLTSGIKKAYLQDNKRYFHTLQERSLRSFSMKRVAAKEVCKKKFKDVCHDALAREMDLWQPPEASAKCWLKPKPDGGFRVVFSFGAHDRAKQVLLRNVICPRFTPSERQYFSRGGHNAAVKEIQKLFREYPVVAEFDAVDCYSSFNVGGAASFLHLPEKVGAYTLSGSHRHIIPPNDKEIPSFGGDENLQRIRAKVEAKIRMANLGLMAGSKVAPVVAEMLFKSVCQAVLASRAGIVINYADNFFLLAKSESALKELSNILSEALRSHPAGPLQVHEKLFRPAKGQAFEFLGYRLQPTRHGLIASMSQANEQKAKDLRKELRERINYTKGEFRKEELFQEVSSRHFKRIKAFPLFLGGQRYHQEKMAKVRAEDLSCR